MLNTIVDSKEKVSVCRDFILRGEEIYKDIEQIWTQRQTCIEGKECEDMPGEGDHVTGMCIYKPRTANHQKLEESRKDSLLEPSKRA